MKILKKTLRQGIIQVQIESADDVWILRQIIDPGDHIQGKTQRKIKIEGGSERTTNVARKWVSMEILVEKQSYDGRELRITGPISEGPEDIPRGSYHSFALEEGATISIRKTEWPQYQLTQIQEAAENKHSTILLLIFDREDAIFANSNKSGYAILTAIHGSVPKKDKRAQVSGNFFADVIKQLTAYNERLLPDHIIIASPSFWKDELMTHIPQSLQKKCTPASCSGVSESTIHEVLRRPEVQTALRKDRSALETNAVESLFAAIAKEKKYAYGLAEVKEKSEHGAIETLLITDSCIQDSRESQTFSVIEQVLKATEASQGTILIISSNHEAGKRLNGLGGIGALLRY